MDVRQFAFLAGRPSAALKNCDHFLGLPKRGIAFLLANVMFWQPLWAQADGIVVSAPGTTLGQAGNGVPIVNIAAPNASGLSHNQFQDYNVGSQGVILNNATNRTQSTQLGGIILGNSNLNGRAASTILNEVNGGSPSQLRGYTEVAGQSAHVIVANPYGITCNGCGFINTPQATLTTGKAVITNGQVSGYQVDRGSVSIEGAGLNANNIDRFEIITRSAKLNAEIQAKNLAIITGANDVDAKTLKAAARTADPASAPQLAIDSSALGGMYAGAIKLVGTEAGVGVKLDGKMVASGGDIQLDANGHLSMVDTAATGAVNAKAQSLEAKGPVYAGTTLEMKTLGDLTSQNNLVAKDRITLNSGGQLTNKGIIEAGVNVDNSRNTEGDVEVTAQNVNNTGKNVIASRDLKVVSTQTLNNQGGSLSGTRQTAVTAGTLDNQSKGRILSADRLTLTADTVRNGQEGLISSNGHLVARVGSLNNRNGEVSSLGSATLSITTLDNMTGQILSDGNLAVVVSGTLANHDGMLSSSSSTILRAASLDNVQGQVTGDLGLNIDLGGALDNQGGTLGSGGALTLTAASLDNRADGTVLASGGGLTATIRGAIDNREQGKLRATGTIDLATGSLDNRGGSLTGKGQMTLRSASVDNRGGLIQADQDAKLRVDQLDNRDKGNLLGKAAVTYEGTRLDNRGGLLSASGPVTLKAREVANAQGRIASQGDVTANIDTLNQQGGALVAQGALLLTGKNLDNRNGGTVASIQGLTLDVDQIDNRAGELSSTSGKVKLNAQRLDNSGGGKLLAETDLALTVAQLINQTQGRLFAKGSASLVGTSLDNTGSTFSALKGLDIRLDGALLNSTGLLSSEGALLVKASSLDNTNGQVGSAGDLSIDSLGALLNQGGSVLTDHGLSLTSSRLDNSQKGRISGLGAVRVTTGTFDNSQEGRLVSYDRLDLTAAQVNNAAGRIASGKELTANVTGLDQQGGELFSKTRLDLDLNNGQLNNQAGLINGPLLVLKNLKGVNNQGGEISSAQAFTLAAQSLDNSNGKLLGDQGLTLRIEQALNNVKGLVSAASLDSRSASLDNSQGQISSRGQADVAVSGVFSNQSGTLIGDGAILLAAGSLNNGKGAISGKADITATIASLDNQSGKLIAQGNLSLSGSALDNRQNGLVGATKALKLNVEQIDNRAGELSANANINVTASRLDNRDGGKVLADTTLAVNSTQVLNGNQGLLKGKTGLTLDGQTLDNTNGQLISGQDSRITLTGDLDNSQGLISSEGQLDVSAAKLTNSAGSLSSAGTLTAKATAALINQGGRLVSDSDVILNSASLDNSVKGVISGKGAVGVTTGAFDNSTGSLTSADRLTLTAGQVTNQGGRIGSDKALTASVTGLDQQGGRLFSNSTLTLDLNHGQLNNQNGLINAPLLVLNNLKGVNNQGGEISSAQAFTLAADSLDNSNGKLLGDQAVTLRVNQALTNLKGLIAAAALDIRAARLDNAGGTLSSRSNLGLSTSGQLDNQAQGLINAAQTLTINSGDLNNQGGVLLGRVGVTLNAMALNNGGNGLINSQGGLGITAAFLDSSNGGEVSSQGDIDLSVSSLTQNGGRLLSDQAIRLDLAGGDLDNRNGLLSAKGPLTLNNLRDLNNQNGELSSRQSFNVVGRNLDNSNGKLISNDQLGVTGNTLTNQNGLISGWQGLNVKGASLDNRNSGTLSSRSGNLDVNLSGALLNGNKGALVSQQTLTVKTDSLDNSAGILSSGASQKLTVTGLLNNAQDGSIDSGAALTLNAMALNNAGSISAEQAIDFTGTDLDNSNGTLTGNGAITLDLLGALTNTRGKLASAGPLVISRSSQISNQGGELVSQGLLSLLTGSLDNRNHGTVAANGNLQITSNGALQNNADGLIYSQAGDLTVNAASLSNGKGALQGQGALNLTVTGDIDNQSGKLLAQNGNLTVSAANLDNRGGTLSSLKGALETQIVGVLKNGYDLNNNRQGGILQGQSLKLKALGGLDNYGGRISAQTGDALITTADVDNRNGGIYAKGLVQVTGNNFDNSGDNDGQIAGQRIDLSLDGALNNRLGIIESDSTLSVRAASLDNQTGQLRALGTSSKTDFQIGGLFDNRNGKLETANSDLTLNVGGFQNQGGSLLHVGNGTFDIATDRLLNAGGSVTTRGGLSLTADNWTNSSVLQVSRLTLNIGTLNQTAGGQLLAVDSLTGSGGNWNNDGLIASDGTASLNLTGSYGGNGRYSSQGTLGLNAASVSLGSAGSIAGGGDTTINVAGALGNSGRITSAAGLDVTAAAINNYGTLGSNAALRLSTPSLLNENGLIFSAGDSNLQVNDFTNDNADVYSLGNLIISGVNGGRASSINNLASSINVDGDFSLSANTFNNKTQGVIGKERLLSGDITFNSTTFYVTENYTSDSTITGARASLAVAGNIDGEVGSFSNTASLVSAGKNIRLNVDSFENKGLEAGNFTRYRVYTNVRNITGITNKDGGPLEAYAKRWSQYAYRYWKTVHEPDKGGTHSELNDFNKQKTTTLNPSFGAGPDVALPVGILAGSLSRDDKIFTAGGGSVASVVQAGQAVQITAKNTIDNSNVHANTSFSGTTKSGVATQVGSATNQTIAYLHSQLPPDLAQQQVNPLALAGFSLPTGQNGLFRLSGQAGSVQQASQVNGGSQSWSMGSAAISDVRRQQDAGGAQASTLQFSDSARITASNLQLEQNTRQAVDSRTSGTTINVPAPGDVGSLQLPGRSDAISPVGSQVINRVQGLPDNSGKSNPQKYLVETNPVLTDLKQFMSSDYLLSHLGYNPDESAKRLGDGFYEQKLIQQAVVARTGQRFIDGQTSDEALYKYLMDNAVKSKQELNLAVGVTLTSEQVAALTHDIVWLEEHEVNGEKVLVPVLYLAQATNRLAPNGALIQGADVTLIAGKDLNNAGTLRASNSLSVTSGNDLTNGGLIEAGNRLDLLAGGDVVNKTGGIIAGRDITMTAIAGDVINERTISGINVNYKGYEGHEEYADNGARIESANELTIKAARDFVSTGSTLQSGGDMTIRAGRDAFIASAEQHNSVVAGGKSNTITQHGSDLTVGGDLFVQAGRDLAVVASQIEVKRDIDFSAGENLTVASAADESHSYSKTKKVTKQEDHVKQISSVLSAGNDISFSAGQDMTLISSRINAANEAYLVADGKLDVLAAQDTDYSLYDKKDKGSWGRKQTKRDEVTKTTNVGTQITTGGDLTLVSGGDQHYQAAKLESGADLTLRSGGGITFEGVKDLSQESHEKSRNSLAWNSSKGKGHTDETLRQSELISKGNLAITAAKGLRIDIKQVDQQTVSQTIDAMVQADPQLAWLKEAEKRGDVDWQRVKEVHESFKYSNSGMGMGAMLAVVIIVTVLTAGSGTASVVGTTATNAATAAGLSATTAAAVGAAAAATYTAMVVQSVVSTINNKGNLAAVLKDVTSAESIKGYVTSGLAAGFASGVLDKAFGVSAENAGKATHGFELASTDGFTKFASYTLAEKGFSAVTNTAINGGSLKNNLAQASISAVADVLSASIYNRLGTQLEFTGVPAKVGAHAIVGGLIAEAAGGSFRSGALAAGANEAFVASVGDKIFIGDMHDQLLAMTSQLIGVTVAAAAGGSDKDQEVAGWVTQQATKFNSLDHPTAELLLNELKACKAGGNCTEAKQRDLIDKFERISAARSQMIDLCESRECVEGLRANTVTMDDPVAKELVSFYRNKITYDMVGMLTGNPAAIAQPAQGFDPWGNTYVTDDLIITAKYVKEGWLTPAESAHLKEWEDKTSWLDEAVGHKLSVAERAAMISNIGNTLLTEGWGNRLAIGTGTGGKVGTGGAIDADVLGATGKVTKPVRPCCFAAGTPVATPYGPRAIDTLKVGDIVWSKPEAGGEPFAAAIVATHIRTDQPIYRLKLKNIRSGEESRNEILLVTPGHPFYVPGRHDFVPAVQLKAGDLLQSLSDGATESASTRVESLELFLPQGRTYNLTVDVGHTFYVGKLKTWVHNVGLCDINGKPIVPRNEKDLSGGPLENATKFKGNFESEGGPPNGTLYRADNRGNITSYAVYDSNGMILKRVDVTGKPHAGVPTPHAIDYGRNVLPDGSIRVQSPSTKKPPREISAEEMP